MNVTRGILSLLLDYAQIVMVILVLYSCNSVFSEQPHEYIIWVYTAKPASLAYYGSEHNSYNYEKTSSGLLI